MVDTLVAGYGKGSSATLHMGTIKAPVWAVQNVAFSTPGGVSYFALFMVDAPAAGTGYALMESIVACKNTGRVICAGSNASGSSLSASQAYTTGTPSVAHYPGISFDSDKVFLLAPSSPSVNSRWLQVNKQYVWIGW